MTDAKIPAKSLTFNRPCSCTSSSAAAIDSWVTTRCAWPERRTVGHRTHAVVKLPTPLNHFLNCQACITMLDQHSPVNFCRFYTIAGQNRITGRCCSLVHDSSGMGIFKLSLKHRVFRMERDGTLRTLLTSLKNNIDRLQDNNIVILIYIIL